MQVVVLLLVLIIKEFAVGVEFNWPLHDIQYAVRGLISRELGNEYINEVSMDDVLYSLFERTIV